MNSQNNIETDMFWLRKNPESPVYQQQPNQYGQHFMNYNASNTLEQIEMSFRSVGRDYNWELQRYTMDKKPSDKGNRRRFMKNTARFFKNPFGYLYWKMPLQRIKFNPFVVVAGGCFLFLFSDLKKQVVEKDKECEFLITKGYKKGGELDLSIPDQDLKLGNNFSFVNILHYERAGQEDHIINPSYRQNYRKYFDRGL